MTQATGAGPRVPTKSELGLRAAVLLTAAWIVVDPWQPGMDASFRLLEMRPLATCPWPAAAEARQGGVAHPVAGDVAPLRVVRDPYSTMVNVAVDPENDEVVVSDDNLFSLLVYGRTFTYSGLAEPRRRLSGHKTKIEFICGVAIDPTRREMYTVNNDIMDNMLVFSHQQSGDVAPVRELKVDHGAWGVELDLVHDEVAISIQHLNKIAIYRRGAEGTEKTVRFIQGEKTGIADPHGVFVDTEHDEIFVVNHGNWHLTKAGESGQWNDRPQWWADSAMGKLGLVPSTGRFERPSIRVFGRTVNGDVAPLRVIEGPATGLNMPLDISVDHESDEIVIANDGSDAVLFFKRTATGNAAPTRVLQGPATQLKNPAGVEIDPKNDELWVSNWGDHSATVYPRTARGNAAPRRTIRSAPPKAPLPGLGNPGAVAYNPARQEILVPN